MNNSSSKSTLTTLALAFAVTAGCGGGATPPAAQPGAASTTPSAAGTAPSAAPTTFAEQVALGQELYGKNCASCHGAAGRDGKAPAVVGLDKGALPLDPPATSKYRKEKFVTVADVAKFVVTSMPPKAAGSLGETAYYAILAFDLKANGIDLGQKKLDGTVAPTLVIPRK